jgi:hypothetical protein
MPVPRANRCCHPRLTRNAIGSDHRFANIEPGMAIESPMNIDNPSRHEKFEMRPGRFRSETGVQKDGGMKENRVD